VIQCADHCVKPKPRPGNSASPMHENAASLEKVHWPRCAMRGAKRINNELEVLGGCAEKH
jgi:hypothetical protein